MARLRAVTPPEPPTRRRPGVPLVASVILHVAIGAGLLELLLAPRPHSTWLSHLRGAPPTVERIGFLALPTPGVTNEVGKSGGNGRPVTHSKPARKLAAPQVVPTGVRPVTPGTAPASSQEDGTGAVVGAGGAGQGIRPQYTDPRVWVGRAPALTAPRSTNQQLDSALAASVQAHNDTQAMLAGRQAGDWTFKSKNGQEWGMDQKLIRLGPVSIPNAVLALLPINHLSDNPVLGEREAQLNAMHDDIRQHAQRQLNENEFRKAVKEVRERKEREHEDEIEYEQQHLPKPSTPPTIARDGSPLPPPPSDNSSN